MEQSDQKSNITLTPVVGYAIQLLFNKIFCKEHGLAGKGLLASGGQPKARFFETYMKPLPGMIFNCSKFH
jgi:hypothetical protein